MDSNPQSGSAPSEAPQTPPAPLRERPTHFSRVTVEEVFQHCQDLRTLLNATFVALLVLSLSVNLFLAKQMRQVRARVTEARPVVLRMQAEFQKKEPNTRNFVNALVGYAATDREFQAVLARYREALPQYLGTSIAVSSAPSVPALPSNPTIGQPLAPTPNTSPGSR
jgi:hypothetical protein